MKEIDFDLAQLDHQILVMQSPLSVMDLSKEDVIELFTMIRDLINTVNKCEEALSLAITKLKELNQNIIVDKIERLLNE